MATGDASDFAARLRTVLPERWFPDDAPVLDAVLSGLGAQWTQVWALLGFARQQTRLATATGAFLDLAAQDFLGSLPRRANETDTAYSYRLRREVFRPRNTRAAIVQVLHDLTGNTPTVFRPSNAADTGGYGIGCGYNVGGGYGSLTLPFQALVTVARGTAPGYGQPPAFSGPVSGWNAPLAGYGVGAGEYASSVPAIGAVTDDDIYAAVASVTPVGHVNWVQITGTPMGGLAVTDDFRLDVNNLA